MHLIRFIFVGFFLFSCSKKEDYSSIQVIGHAGMGLAMSNSMYHDNSKESVEYALKMRGCDGVEIDIQLSSDGEFWLYHDQDLNTETNFTGCISEMSFQDLNNVKYNSWYHEKLCRLKDIDSSLLVGKTLYLDIRTVNFCKNMEVLSQSLLDALNSISFLHNSGINTVVVSNNHYFLSFLSDNGYNVALEIDVDFDFLNFQLLNSSITEFIVKNNNITSSQISFYKSNGIDVTIFEMRSASGIRKALKKNPKAIMTDDLREAIIEVY